MKKVCSIMLALLLALTAAAPGHASETDPEAALSPEPETVETVQPDTPVSEETDPPAPEETESPAPQETDPPVPEETEPPAPQETDPPAPEETDPPAPEETDPPAPEETESPATEEADAPTQEETPEQEGQPVPLEETSPVIDVTVPQIGSIVINPYGLPVELDNGEISTAQIAGRPLSIDNRGEAPIAVYACAAGSVSDRSTMEIVDSQAQLDTGIKGIFLYAEFKGEHDSWGDGYDDAENQLLILNGTSESKAVLNLNSNESGEFQLFGAASTAPAVPWGAEDEIHVTFTFTFELVEMPEQQSESVETPAPEEAKTLAPEEAETPAPGGETESPAPDETETPAPEEADPARPEEASGPTVPKETEPPTPDETESPELK